MAGIATGIAAASLLYGIYKGEKGAQQQSDAQKAMEAQARNSPLWKPDKSVNDYYQAELNRFLENPTQSAQYKLGEMNANIATAQGINALQYKKSAIGGIDALGRNQNFALQNLGAQSVAQQAQKGAQLGTATQMMNAENQFGFDVNKMTPYNRQFGLTQEKAAAGGQMANAGQQTAAAGLNNLSAIYAAKAKTSQQKDYLNFLKSQQLNSQIPGSSYDSYPINDIPNPNLPDTSEIV